MSNPADIRAAIASTLQSRLSGWSVSSTWRSSPEPPQLDMMLGPINYDTAMQAGNEDIRYIIRATVQAGEDIAYQQALDPLVDWGRSGTATSLKAALEVDPTLGGTVSNLRVTDVTELKTFPTPGGALPGVEFTVVVTPN